MDLCEVRNTSPSLIESKEGSRVGQYVEYYTVDDQEECVIVARIVSVPNSITRDTSHYRGRVLLLRKRRIGGPHREATLPIVLRMPLQVYPFLDGALRSGFTSQENGVYLLIEWRVGCDCVTLAR